MFNLAWSIGLPSGIASTEGSCTSKKTVLRRWVDEVGKRPHGGRCRDGGRQIEVTGHGGQGTLIFAEYPSNMSSSTEKLA